MIRATRPHRRADGRLALVLAAGGALAVLLAGAQAEAAGPRDTAALKAMKQALEGDYLETRFDDAERRLRAAIQRCGKLCSKGVRAKLNAALGSVLAGGKKELTDARDAFVEALTLDPKIQPNPDILSAEVTFAFEQAKKQLHLAPAAPEPAEEKVEKPPPPPPVEEAPKPVDEAPKPVKEDGEKAADEPPAPPPPPPQPAKLNWIYVSYMPDLAVVSGSNVCTHTSRTSGHFYCVRPNGTQYVGTPTTDNGDDIHTGLALATMSVSLGYDRVLHPNVSLGVRVGFAFNGASQDGGPFVPLHAEARLGIWPGHEPFGRNGVRPFFVVAGGVEQVDAKVSVKVVEDGATCGAMPPQSTTASCTLPSSDGTVEPRQQSLTVYKQSGLGFAAAGFGLMFAPSQRVGIHLLARGGVTFPIVAAVIMPELGVEVGF